MIPFKKEGICKAEYMHNTTTTFIVELGFKPNYICLHGFYSRFYSAYIYDANRSTTMWTYIWAESGIQNGGVDYNKTFSSSYGFNSILDNGFKFTDPNTSSSYYYCFAMA